MWRYLPHNLFFFLFFKPGKPVEALIVAQKPGSYESFINLEPTTWHVIAPSSEKTTGGRRFSR
jgi:hypothetical protein